MRETFLVERENPETGETELVPDPRIEKATDAVSDFIPGWGGLVEVGVMGALGLWAGLENRRKKKALNTSEVLVSNVDDILSELDKALANNPGLGKERVAKLKQAIKTAQAGAGVWEQVNAILKRRGRAKSTS